MHVHQFFPDIIVLNKYRALGWKFGVESWQDKEDKAQYALTFQSPRMKTPETTYLDELWGQTLKDEEAWVVARRFMEENTMFRGIYQQAMMDLFHKNIKVNPDNIEIELSFKVKKKGVECSS